MFYRFLIVTFSLLIVLLGTKLTNAQSLSVNLSSKTVLWKVKAQAEVGADSVKIYTPGCDVSSWVNAVVPGTVFTSYVDAGLEKDPNFGDNIYQVDKKKYDRNFWYRSEFTIPADFKKEKIWLNFNGINRKAEIFLNSIKIGSLDGFMQRGNFDITNLVSNKAKNVLAVLVVCPQTPLVNYASPTYISSAGWDWMPYVPGLESGITDNVTLSNTGDITIIDPWIRTDLPTNARADLSINVGIKNNTLKPLNGIVNCIIMPGNVQFSQKIFIGANNSTAISFNKKRYEQLMIDNPKLWWPNGYGDPNLYTCQFIVKVGDTISDSKKITFGIRKYSYDTVGHVFHLLINGTKVFIKGGNWGMSEYMLRCRDGEYDTKLRLHKDLNFNMIRNWIGSTTDDAFYEACDRYGMMVWDDFWLNSINNLPTDIISFNNNAIEKIKRLRNHPSIAVWCGDNEGYPNPPLNGWLREDVSTYDKNDRWYQPNSHEGDLTGSGPWTNNDIKWYFTKSPNGFGGNPGWGMRSEIGTAVFVNFESFKKFMPKENWWPRNEMWNKHFFGKSAGNASPDVYDATITRRYGVPTGIEDYCRKAQLLNIETNKALYEGWVDNMWEDASGVLTWMSQSAYPSLVWQTYDYYYDLNGAYWGAKKGSESLHVQWNPAVNSIKVINTTPGDVNSLTVEASIYNMDGKEVKEYRHVQVVDARANTATHVFNFAFARENLALHKQAFASSWEGRNRIDNVTDGDDATRWASLGKDNEWIYVDLGSKQDIDGVGLNWEEAYAKSFKIQVSDDAKDWHDVLTNHDGNPGLQQLTFGSVNTRYVRMYGLQRGTGFGFSLWGFEVYGSLKNNNLSAVHFIKLKLKDNKGALISDNFYWRGNKWADYTALNTLAKVDLKTITKIIKEDGKYYIIAKITNPESSPGIAFAIRVQAVKASNGEEILPVFTNDNYFSLLKGESKDIKIEFDASIIGNDTPILKVEPYNN